MFIVKIPLINGLGKTKGCERAGNAVLKALEEIYSSESGKPIDVKLLDLEEIHIDNSNLNLSEKLIYENCLEIFGEKPRTIFLGGDHSISYPTGKAFLDYCNRERKEPCLIVFDAHPDCMPSMKNPTHEEWLRALIEKGTKNSENFGATKSNSVPSHDKQQDFVGFPTKNILLVGTRNSDREEIEFIKKNKIKTISINQLQEDLEETCEVIMEFSHEKELYLSLDIDIVDPAFAPATGYPEIGGLTSREFIYLIQRMNKIKNLKAVDIVEINPEKDKEFNMITTKLGAKILSELI
ncbi:MAG: arginase family protein [archaeon]|nr:arginase family protein [archaeon]